MTSETEPSQSQSTGRGIEALARNPRRAAVAFFVASAALTAIPIVVGVKYRLDYLNVAVWGALLALLALIAGFWNFLQVEPGPERALDVDASRMMVLVVGGLAGLVTAVLGAALAWHWWGRFTGGLEAWRKEWWRIALCMLALFGGLAMMFVSLQLARTDERSNPSLRRLLYGYNAALAGLLLFAILAVINMLTYVPMRPFTFFSTPSDWTESTIYTLSKPSKELLEHLKKPVKVYVIMPTRSGERQEVTNLMDNCRAVTNKFEVEYLSPDFDPERLFQLQNKYATLGRERSGLLVVFGTEGNETNEFIPTQDLFHEDQGQDRMSAKPHFQFNGENELMKKINYLDEDKARSVIYFTQGNGEFDLNSSDDSRFNIGMAVLKDRLQKANYDVKELKFGPGAERVPADAGVVVVARPALRLPDGAVEALVEYMNPIDDKAPKGKLVVLTDIVEGPEGGLLQTGLETLLEQFNVQLGNDRILSVTTRQPGFVVGIPKIESQNPIAQAFSDVAAGYIGTFLFDGARSVNARSGESFGARSKAEVILEAPASQGLYAESNLKADIAKVIADLRKADAEEQRAKLSRQAVPLAVAVADSVPRAPTGDPHDALKPQDQRPRLVVFGDATWVSNRMMSSGVGKVNYDLFANTLSWLRERPTSGNFADPKDRSVFVLNAPEATISRLYWLPAMIMFVAIISIGGSVWVVRRR